MENGDISNAVAPRFLVVFEGLVGHIPNPLERKREQFYVRMRQWKRAARLWEIDRDMLTMLWNMAWRHQYPVDGATYLPESYAEALQERLDDMNVPLAHFQSYGDPDDLAKALAYMPYVHTVFYAWPPRPFIFGDRGHFVERAGEVVPY